MTKKELIVLRTAKVEANSLYQFSCETGTRHRTPEEWVEFDLQKHDALMKAVKADRAYEMALKIYWDESKLVTSEKPF